MGDDTIQPSDLSSAYLNGRQKLLNVLTGIQLLELALQELEMNSQGVKGLPNSKATRKPAIEQNSPSRSR